MNIKYTIVVSILFFCFTSTQSTEAFGPSGRNGWMTPISSLIGDDASCGPNFIKIDLEILEYGTNNPVTVNNATLVTFDRATYDEVNSVEGTGPIVSSICMNPDTDGIGISINGGPLYYDFWTSNTWSNPETIQRGKHYRETVWLVPSDTNARQYIQTSPVNAYTKDPNTQYIFNLDALPTNYGANSILNAQFFLVDSQYNIVDRRTVSLTGGIGSKTIPATPNLVDGTYSWAAYLALNGTNTIASSSLQVLDVLKSGLMDLNWPFMLDTTPPEIQVSSGHVPTIPSDTDLITITGEAIDVGSGIVNMKVFIDGVQQRNCDFAQKNNALCDFTVGPHPVNTTMSYYFTATDVLGNTATSTPQSFTVQTMPPPLQPPVTNPISCTIPITHVTSSSTADGMVENGVLQTLKVVGNYAYAGGSDFGDDKGLYIYDISDTEHITQVSFFSTNNPASVQNYSWGNSVTGIDVVGNYAYLTTYYGGLVIVNISNPSNPTFTGKLALQSIDAGAPESWDVKIKGNYAFVASGKGMMVIDILDKSNPTLVSKVDLGASVSQSIFLSDSFAYVAMRDNGLAIIDIRNPLVPVIMSQFNDAYNGSNWAYSVALNGNYLYVANNFAGAVRIYDIANASSPTFVANLQLPAGVMNLKVVTIENGVLYVGAGSNGAYVYDISNQIIPSLVYQVNDSSVSGFNAKIWNVTTLPSTDFKKLIMVSATNNISVYITDTTCDIVPQPDLVVSNTTIPGTADTITPVSLSAEITNNGTAGTGAGFTNLFQKTTDIIANSSSMIDIGTSISPLSPAQTSADSLLQYTFPSSDAGTTQYVRVCTDKSTALDAGIITESNESNNCSTWKPITVTGGTQLLDLVANSVSPLDNSIYKSGSINFTGTVQNIGSADIAEGGNAGLDIDWNFSFPGGFNVDQYFAIPDNSTTLGAFNVGETKQLSYLVPDVPIGSHGYRFNVDSTNQLTETDELNNFSEWRTITVISGELNASSYSIQGGESVNFDWTVQSPIDVSCEISNLGVTWTGASTNGNADSPELTSDTTFVLSCNGVALDSVFIEVNTTPELTIIPRIVPKDTDAVISWNTHNGDESLCTLKTSPEAQNLIDILDDVNTGFITVPITGRTTYTLECPNGSKSFLVEIVPNTFES